MLNKMLQEYIFVKTKQIEGMKKSKQDRNGMAQNINSRIQKCRGNDMMIMVEQEEDPEHTLQKRNPKVSLNERIKQLRKK